MSLMISVSGIRGRVGETLTPQLVGEFAAAFAAYLGPGSVVVGRDSRPSGEALSRAVVEHLARCGRAVIELGIATTPGTALMVRAHAAAGGMVITASHNPAEWNGLKFLLPPGIAPHAEQAAQIWARQRSGAFRFADHAGRGQVQADTTTDRTHSAAVLQTVEPQAIAERRFRVVLDSINGAGGTSGHMLLEALGCDVVHLNAQSDGRFAHPPEPIEEHLADLCAAVRAQHADLGFAQDPDADRLAVVDHSGRYVGEEYTLALAAKYMFTAQPGPAATNLSTSRMIDDLARAAGGPCTVYRSPVGEANVAHCILEHDCVFGGEGNGGVIDPAVVQVRDSLVAMARILQLMAQQQQPLSALVADLPAYTMIKKKQPCSSDKIAGALERVKKAFRGAPLNDVDGVRIDWPEGWVHIRASNTEPIVRLIAEAQDRDTAEALVERVSLAAEL